MIISFFKMLPYQVFDHSAKKSNWSNVFWVMWSISHPYVVTLIKTPDTETQVNALDESFIIQWCTWSVKYCKNGDGDVLGGEHRQWCAGMEKYHSYPNLCLFDFFHLHYYCILCVLAHVCLSTCMTVRETTLLGWLCPSTFTWCFQ